MQEFNVLRNKIALVTGGGTGLGYATAKKLATIGMRPVIVGRNEKTLDDACQRLGTQSRYFVFDLSHISSIPGLVSTIEDEVGPVDVLVNNSGIHLKKDIWEITDEEYQNVITINQNAVFVLSREFAKRMQSRKSGNIIMISSMASFYGIPKVSAYTASKAAVEGMTRALAVELSPMGIRVNCVAPGFIKTEMSSSALDSDPQRKERVLSRTPLKRLGEPDDIANAVLFLVSDAAKYITGVVLPVDGGNSIGF
jgi:gluconate 5-dehydrogenase